MGISCLIDMISFQNNNLTAKTLRKFACFSSLVPSRKKHYVTYPILGYNK